MTSLKIKRHDLPVLAIVGRANVGKSTLWNRITEQQRAIVSNTPHTTRDRNIELATWRGSEFELIDTGGVDVEENEIGEGIKRQTDIAITDADLILFMIDVRTGILDEDRAFSKELRRSKKPIIVVANKVDTDRDIAALAESGVYGLGFGDPIMISAGTGKGIGDLLDRAYEELNRMGRSPSSDRTLRDSALGHRKSRREMREMRAVKTEAEHEKQKANVDLDPHTETSDIPLRIVVMGRTNVGKSSLVNSILGEERVIVSNIPHTTREPQDTLLRYKNQDIILVDTAGMRKRSNMKEGIETEALDRNKDALDRADIAFLVIDLSQEIHHQDKALGGLMQDATKGLIIVANKWDLLEDKTPTTPKEAEHRLRAFFPFLEWAPIHFVSAKDHRRTKELLDLAIQIQHERERVIEYNAINRLLKQVIKQKKPLQVLGPKSPHIHDIAQTGTRPPTFLVTVRGEKENIHPNWVKFLERRIRDKFGFEGTPILVRATNVPISKSERAWNLKGPGMGASEIPKQHFSRRVGKSKGKKKS
jgi:GTP-binding protein